MARVEVAKSISNEVLSGLDHAGLPGTGLLPDLFGVGLVVLESRFQAGEDLSGGLEHSLTFRVLDLLRVLP
jgi:hypothetical protein